MAEKLGTILNGPLTDALARAAAAGPEDPVDFIGKYLLNWADAQATESARAEAAEKAAAVIAEAREAASAEEAAQAALDAEAAALSSADNKLAARLGEAHEHFGSFIADVVSHARARTGSSAAYVAEYKQAGEEPNEEEDAVRYVYCVGGTDLTGTELPAGAGVTRRAWATVDALGEGDDAPPAWAGWVEPPVAPLPEDEADAEATDEATDDSEGGAAKPVPYAPGPADFVHVPNVMRDAAVHFLAGRPALGGFLAVPFAYDSSLHPAAPLDVADEPESEEEGDDAGEEEDGDEDEDEEEQGEGGADGEGTAEEDEDDEEEELGAVPEDIEPFALRKMYVMCFDKLGKALPFDAEERAAAVRWCRALGAGLQGAERALWEREVLQRRAARRKNRAQLAKWLAVQDEEEAAVEAAVEALRNPPSPEADAGGGEGEGAGEGGGEGEGEGEGGAVADGGEGAEDGAEGTAEAVPLTEEQLEEHEEALRWAVAARRVAAPRERAFVSSLAGLRLALPPAPTALLLCAARTVGLVLEPEPGTGMAAPAGGAADDDEATAAGSTDADANAAGDATGEQGTARWRALQPKLASGEFFDALAAFDADTLASAAAEAADDASSAGALRAEVVTMDAEELQADNVAYVALLMWLEAAHNKLEAAERRLAEARRVAEEEQARARAAEAAEGEGEGDGEQEE
eukprot:g316.t1